MFNKIIIFISLFISFIGFNLYFSDYDLYVKDFSGFEGYYDNIEIDEDIYIKLTNGKKFYVNSYAKNSFDIKAFQNSVNKSDKITILVKNEDYIDKEKYSFEAYGVIKGKNNFLSLDKLKSAKVKNGKFGLILGIAFLLISSIMFYFRNKINFIDYV